MATRQVFWPLFVYGICSFVWSYLFRRHMRAALPCIDAAVNQTWKVQAVFFKLTAHDSFPLTPSGIYMKQTLSTRVRLAQPGLKIFCRPSKAMTSNLSWRDLSRSYDFLIVPIFSSTQLYPSLLKIYPSESQDNPCLHDESWQNSQIVISRQPVSTLVLKRITRQLDWPSYRVSAHRNCRVNDYRVNAHGSQVSQPGLVYKRPLNVPESRRRFRFGFVSYSIEIFWGSVYIGLWERLRQCDSYLFKISQIAFVA